MFKDRNVWVNPDLTRSGREAIFFKREVRRGKQRLGHRSSANVTDITPAEISAPTADTLTQNMHLRSLVSGDVSV